MSGPLAGGGDNGRPDPSWLVPSTLTVLPPAGGRRREFAPMRISALRQARGGLVQKPPADGRGGRVHVPNSAPRAWSASVRRLGGAPGLPEAGVPAARRVAGRRPGSAGDLLIRHPSAAHSNGRACTTLRCAGAVDFAIRVSSTRCSLLTGAVINGIRQTTALFADGAAVARAYARTVPSAHRPQTRVGQRKYPAGFRLVTAQLGTRATG